MAIVQLVCPLCGGLVSHLILTSNPPIDDYRCQNPGCSYHVSEAQTIVRETAPMPK